MFYCWHDWLFGSVIFLGYSVLVFCVGLVGVCGGVLLFVVGVWWCGLFVCFGVVFLYWFCGL